MGTTSSTTTTTNKTSDLYSAFPDTQRCIIWGGFFVLLQMDVLSVLLSFQVTFSAAVTQE